LFKGAGKRGQVYLYKYDLNDEMWFGGGPSLQNSKKKACQMILKFDGEIVWARFGHHT
jgi:hypothetical protein